MWLIEHTVCTGDHATSSEYNKSKLGYFGKKTLLPHKFKDLVMVLIHMQTIILPQTAKCKRMSDLRHKSTHELEEIMSKGKYLSTWPSG
jgi:hypothetical protein